MVTLRASPVTAVVVYPYCTNPKPKSSFHFRTTQYYSQSIKEIFTPCKLWIICINTRRNYKRDCIKLTQSSNVQVYNNEKLLHIKVIRIHCITEYMYSNYCVTYNRLIVID